MDPDLETFFIWLSRMMWANIKSTHEYIKQDYNIFRPPAVCFVCVLFHLNFQPVDSYGLINKAAWT